MNGNALQYFLARMSLYPGMLCSVGHMEKKTIGYKKNLT